MGAKSPRQASAYKRWRASLPARAESAWGRCLAWLDMQIMDHGFMRPFFNRPYEFAPGVYRSNQPTPRRIRVLAKQGVRTIINLRGDSDRGAYVLETWACKRYGIQLIDLDMASRKPPKPEKVHRLLQMIQQADKLYCCIASRARIEPGWRPPCI